jgi:DNA (cytosine-5)-methyltransferase 1
MNDFSNLRERAGLNPQEAAEKLGISPRTVYRWESGESKPHPSAIRTLRELADAMNRCDLKRNGSFNYIDLFAGIGGFRKAVDSVGGNCVFTSEWDKACRATYQANYDCNHIIAGDIREFTGSPEGLSQIPKHDLLVGGFPCQPFSIAGVSKKNSLGRPHGFRCDSQGTLFFDLAQIIDFHRPSAILLENVKNLKSHDKGRTFEVICRTLEDDLGYHIDTRVIDARYWVPQHRERIFIAGFKKDVDFSFNEFRHPSPDDSPVVGSILHHFEEEDEAPYFENGRVNEKYTLTPKLWKYLIDYKNKHQAKGNGFGFSLVEPQNVTRTLSARYYKDGSEILVKQGEIPRRLTPRECARLMGFDGPGESNFKIPVSDTQAYKQFGNAVAVPVAKAVAEYLNPFLQRALDMERKSARSLVAN